MILVVCLVLGKRRLPRLLFMTAASLDLFFGDLMNFLNSSFLALFEWLASIYYAPLFSIYGSPLALPFALKFVLLATIIYAVWDQLSRELAQQQRVNAELKAAHEVQTVLVAAEERGAPGYAVASVYRPASEVGGDFFQVIPLHEDGTLIVAGDVSGKGLRAAMTVSLIVGAVRTLVEQDPSPAAVLAGLNRRLIGRTQGGFATCCAVRIHPTGHAILANAGHCQPYLDGREVELPAGLPLGLVEGMTYDEIAVEIDDGHQFTLVSDGVVEARNHHGELYGFERLSQLMSERPSAEHVANTAIDFGQDDDITVLTVTRLAAKPDAATQLSGLSPAPA
jgi:serine phosphatase RsbU (regulator of sigma subunit)